MKQSLLIAIATAASHILPVAASERPDPKLMPTLEEVRAAADPRAPMPPGWVNETVLCDSDRNKTMWDTYRINKYLTYIAEKVKEQHDDQSVQQYLIDQVHGLGTSKNYDACTIDSNCGSESSITLAEMCVKNPSATWVLQAYRYWAACWRAVSDEAALQIGSTIDIKLRELPEVFASGADTYDWGEGEIDGDKWPNLMFTVLGGLASLAPNPVLSAGLSGSLSVINGFLGAQTESPWSKDIQWRLYSNISQSLPQLIDTYRAGFNGLIDMGVTPSKGVALSPKEFSKDEAWPHVQFMQSDWISKMPSVSTIDWTGFCAAIYGTFINHLWTKSDKHVLVARISPSIGVDPCAGDNVLGANTKVCDGDIAFALVAINKHNASPLGINGVDLMQEDDRRSVPGLVRLKDYGITVGDVVRSSWRHQKLYGFTSGAPNLTRTIDDVRSLARQNVPKAERVHFTLPVCDIETA